MNVQVQRTHVTQILKLYQTFSLLMLLRFHFKPSVSFMFWVVICDCYILLALEGFPLEAGGALKSGRTGSFHILFIPSPVESCPALTHQWLASVCPLRPFLGGCQRWSEELCIFYSTPPLGGNVSTDTQTYQLD